MTSICGGWFGCLSVLSCQCCQVEALGGQTLSSVIKRIIHIVTERYTVIHLDLEGFPIAQEKQYDSGHNA